MAQQVRNPFLHTHDHDHDHDHEHDHAHDHLEMADPAQQSLADALRVSFGLLKWIMVILIVVYLFTGIFSVSPQERAVRLRFGELVGGVYGEGWHVGLPYPIEQYILIPITPQKIVLDRAFWFRPVPGSEGQTLDQMGGGPLNPERDGSLITGDANIMHGQFEVTYFIKDPAAYARNVGEMRLLQLIVRNTAERAIVHVAASTSADDISRLSFDSDRAHELMRQSLETLGAGVEVSRVALTLSTAPLRVRAAYNEVANAESQRAQWIEEARQRATSTLNAAAGEAHDELLALVEAYEMARGADEQDQAEALMKQIDRALDAQEVRGEGGAVAKIGGDAASRINAARTQSTAHVQSVRGDADYFRQMLERYRQAPQLVMSRLWQETRQAILSGKVETIYAPTGQDQRLVIITNRDPRVEQQQQREEVLRQRQEAQNEGGQQRR